MEKKDVKMYCKLKDKEVNIRFPNIPMGIGKSVKTKPKCYENRKCNCIYEDNPECLEKSI